MSEKQQNTNFGYKLCNQGGLHQGECLNYVCVEPICYKNGLICPVCRYENHLSHKVLPFKQFLQQSLEKIPQVFQHQQKLLEQIQNQEEEKEMLMMGFGDEQQDQQNNQNSEQKQNSESEKSQKNCSEETQNDPLEQLQEEIKKQQKQKQQRAQQLLKDLDSIYEKQNNHLVKLSEQVQYLQSQLVNNYKTVRERIINQSEYYQQKIEDDVHLFCEFIKDQGQVNGESQVKADKTENAKNNQFVFKKESLNLNLDQYLQKISNLASISTINDQKFEFSLDFEWTYRKYQNMARDINTLLEDIKLKLTNSNKTVDLKVNQILSKSVTRVVHLDTLLQGKGTEEIKFSQKFLSQFVQLENNNKIAKQSKMQNSDQRFALSAEPLSANEPTRFAVKILKLISWISVGIGIEQVLTSKNFKFIYGSSKLGNGYYMISSNGFKWSHSKISDNVVHVDFQFKQNDIICCVYDPVQKCLKFKHNSTKKQVILEDLKVESTENAHILVGLGQKDEAVELVQQDQFDKLDFPTI